MKGKLLRVLDFYQGTYNTADFHDHKYFWGFLHIKRIFNSVSSGKYCLNKLEIIKAIPSAIPVGILLLKNHSNKN